jgi:hypothetical protein
VTTSGSFWLAKYHAGWRTLCRRSPHYASSIEPPCVAQGEGWEPARERAPKPGYEYALARGCSVRGFAHSAAKTYWKMVRRPTGEQA